MLHQQNTTGKVQSEGELNGLHSMKLLDGVPSGTINLGQTNGTGLLIDDGGKVHNIGGALITNQHGQILGNNSITKMSEIATQLGEAFLSSDLSSLIKQQREMDLIDVAEQKVLT